MSSKHKALQMAIAVTESGIAKRLRSNFFLLGRKSMTEGEGLSKRKLYIFRTGGRSSSFGFWPERLKT